MNNHFLGDPAFLPITIIFVVLVLIAIWQKLDRFIIPLSIVYIVYTVVMILSDTTKNKHVNPELTLEAVDKNINNNEILFTDTIIVANSINVTDEKEIKDTQKESNIENMPKTSLPDLHAISLLICKTVNDTLRRPIGTGKSFPASLGKVYCYSGIRNITGKKTIYHEWYFNNDFITSIPIHIGRSVYWRAWTIKSLSPASIGNWHVIVRDSLSKTALDTIAFTITDG